MPTEPSSKPARDWSVNMSRETPAKPAAAPQSGAVVKPKVLPKPASDHAAPPDAASDRAARRAAHLDKIMAPPPSGGKTAPIAIGLALALLVVGAVVSCRTKHKAAEQRIAQASAAVSGYVSRAEALKKQSAPFLKQLDGALGELQSIASAKAPGKDFRQRLDAAITTVSTVENAVFAEERGPEALAEALETLKGRPDHAALAENVRAAAAEIKAQQSAMDAKCQKVRAMIVSADQQMQRLGVGAK